VRPLYGFHLEIVLAGLSVTTYVPVLHGLRASDYQEGTQSWPLSTHVEEKHLCASASRTLPGRSNAPAEMVLSRSTVATTTIKRRNVGAKSGIAAVAASS